MSFAVLVNFLLSFGCKTLEGVVGRPGGCASIQRDLLRLEKCVGQESHEAQQREVQSPVPGEEQPQAPGQTGD